MTWRVEIVNRTDVVDAVGDGIKEDISDLGITGIEQVRFIRMYTLEGDLSVQDAERTAVELLADPVTQDFHRSSHEPLSLEPGQWGIEVWFRTGVTDNAGETTLKAVKDLGIQGITDAFTGRGYVIDGRLDEAQIDIICRRLLANDIIESYTYYRGT